MFSIQVTLGQKRRMNRTYPRDKGSSFAGEKRDDYN